MTNKGPILTKPRAGGAGIGRSEPVMTFTTLEGQTAATAEAIGSGAVKSDLLLAQGWEVLREASSPLTRAKGTSLAARPLPAALPSDQTTTSGRGASPRTPK